MAQNEQNEHTEEMVHPHTLDEILQQVAGVMVTAFDTKQVSRLTRMQMSLGAMAIEVLIHIARELEQLNKKG